MYDVMGGWVGGWGGWEGTCVKGEEGPTGSVAALTNAVGGGRRAVRRVADERNGGAATHVVPRPLLLNATFWCECVHSSTEAHTTENSRTDLTNEGRLKRLMCLVGR